MRLRIILDAIDALTFRRGRWYAFEQELLAKVVMELPSSTAVILETQVKNIRSIYRSPGTSTVELFFKSGGNTGIDHIPLFNDRSEQLLIATVKLGKEGTKGKLKADLWAVNGHLFEIAYDKSPMKFFGTRDLDGVRLNSIDVNILADPMQILGKDVGNKSATVDTEEVARFFKSKKISNLRPPYPREAIILELTEREISCPPDYVDALTLTDGCKVDGCVVLGLKQVRTMPFREDSVHILADCEGKGVLVVGHENKNLELYFIDYIAENSEYLGQNFRTALSIIRDKPLTN